MNILRVLGSSLKKRDKSIDFTTTDLKFILTMAHCVHNRALNNYMDFRYYGKGNLTPVDVFDLRFKFTISSHILHKICPDTYDCHGYQSLKYRGRDCIEAINFLYSPEFLEDFCGGNLK